MKRTQEEYIHFVSCMKNLNNALNIFQELKIPKKLPPVIFNASFQYAIIEYAKPYKVSKGETLNSREKPEHKLDNKYIPPDFLALHKRLIDARDQIHAHTDLTLLEAKIYIQDTFYGKSVVISQNFIHETQEFSNIDAIIVLIEKTLDNMMEEEKKLKEQLT